MRTIKYRQLASGKRIVLDRRAKKEDYRKSVSQLAQVDEVLVESVMSAMADVLISMLCDGMSVEIQDIGIFYPRLRDRKSGSAISARCNMTGKMRTLDVTAEEVES